MTAINRQQFINVAFDKKNTLNGKLKNSQNSKSLFIHNNNSPFYGQNPPEDSNVNIYSLMKNEFSRSKRTIQKNQKDPLKVEDTSGESDPLKTAKNNSQK